MNVVQSRPFILDLELRHGISRYSKLTNLAALNGDKLVKFYSHSIKYSQINKACIIAGVWV